MERLSDGTWGLDSSLEATAFAIFSGVANSGTGKSTMAKVMFENGLSFTDSGRDFPSIDDELSFLKLALKDLNGGFKHRQKQLPHLSETLQPGRLVATRDIGAKAIARAEERQAEVMASEGPKELTATILRIAREAEFYSQLDQQVEASQPLAA